MKSAASRTSRGAEPNLSDDVYHRLRQAIIDGELRPNEPLVEVDLAERFGVSRTPVRESLPRLVDDGLVESRRRRWVVKDHTRDDIIAIYHVRAALESYAARLAAIKATDDEKDVLRGWLEHDGEVLAVPAGPSRIAANEDFHEFVCACSHQELLRQAAFRGRRYAFINRTGLGYTPDQLAESTEQHRRIARAVIDGRSEEASEHARVHVVSALDVLLHRLV